MTQFFLIFISYYSPFYTDFTIVFLMFFKLVFYFCHFAVCFFFLWCRLTPIYPHNQTYIYYMRYYLINISIKYRNLPCFFFRSKVNNILYINKS